MIPKWLLAYVKDSDIEKIRQAVVSAESITAGEVVPMIVRRSSTIGHVPLMLLSLVVAIFYVMGGPALTKEMLGDHTWVYVLDAVVLFMFTAMGARIPSIQRVLTPRTDQASQVEARAMIEFYESAIHKTEGATGILILVSLLERRAVVLADKAVNDKVPKDTWKNLCDELVCGIRSKNLGEAMARAVENCGKIMAVHFPVRENDTNELRDNLIVKE